MGGKAGEEGYFTTIGGRLLDSTVPVEQLGLQPRQEVVFQGRLKGGGFSGGGKGARGGGGNSVQAGDWTCGNCWQPGCWNTRYSCYRCGASRYLDQGGNGQGNAGARDMEGRYQGGVGSGMGGFRLVGPTGRDQVYTLGGGILRRGKGLNRVGGVTKTR